MPSVLVVARPSASDPAALEPLLDELAGRGWRIALLAPASWETAARRVSATRHPIPPTPVATATARRGLQAARQAIRDNFVQPFETQWPALRRALDEEAPDVVLADALHTPAVLLASVPRPLRPAVAILGTIPAPYADPDAAPYGMGLLPDPSLLNRVRNLVLRRTLRHVLFPPVLVELADAFRAQTGHELQGTLDEIAARVDVWAQCTGDRFEYPGAAQPANVRLVGPLSVPPPAPLPDRWHERVPRVHVRLDPRADPADLLLPAVAAFADGRLVLSGVTRAAAEAAAGPLPDSVEVAEDLPAGQVLPGTAAVVLRGDLVNVHHALQQGVPVVSVGTAADELETGARLTWHGLGVQLRTDRPSAAALEQAVAQLLADGRSRGAAARVAAQAAAARAEETIADLLSALVSAPVGTV